MEALSITAMERFEVLNISQDWDPIFPNPQLEAVPIDIARVLSGSVWFLLLDNLASLKDKTIAIAGGNKSVP